MEKISVKTKREYDRRIVSIKRELWRADRITAPPWEDLDPGEPMDIVADYGCGLRYVVATITRER